MIKELQKRIETGVEKKRDMSEDLVNSIYLGIGSNLGNKRRNIERTKFNLVMNNINIVNYVLLSFNTISLNYSSLRILLIILFLLYMIFLLSSKSMRGYFVGEFLFFILLFFLTLNSSLIYGFSIYFIFFHSLLSINDQVKYIYGDDSLGFIKKYLISALPYFILSILFLIGFYFFIDFESLNIIPIMFTFLAAITFPHVFVIEKMYSIMK